VDVAGAQNDAHKELCYGIFQFLRFRPNAPCGGWDRQFWESTVRLCPGSYNLRIPTAICKSAHDPTDHGTPATEGVRERTLNLLWCCTT